MTRTVIISNRVSLPGERGTRPGGLAVVMRDAVREQGGLWIGWSGAVSEGAGAPAVTVAGRVSYVTVDLSPAEYEEYYLGYANATLWPLLHYRVGLVEYKRRNFDGYLGVNTRFAELVRPLLQPNDLVWVHDFHFLPLGERLRALGAGNRIGFFLHTPFPPAELLTALPQHERLIEALCAYDVVGFQTQAALSAFLQSVRDIAHGEVLEDGSFLAAGRRGRAGVFPVGIDTSGFARLSHRASRSTETHRLTASLAGRRLIIGVDRLDYSKGIPHRFEAIDRLLAAHPEHRRTFNYLQIAPHSREEVAQYRALRRELEALAGRVNGRFAEFDWSPIRYVNKSFSQQTLAGFYRSARVALVTPLRDGMNLVAKEFVAAQDASDPGVLVLSRFAGAAQELTSALQVNPIDADEMAAALHRALGMGLEERQERWRAMMVAIGENTIEKWRRAFLAALAAPIPSQPQLRAAGLR